MNGIKLLSLNMLKQGPLTDAQASRGLLRREKVCHKSPQLQNLAALIFSLAAQDRPARTASVCLAARFRREDVSNATGTPPAARNPFDDARGLHLPASHPDLISSLPVMAPHPSAALWHCQAPTPERGGAFGTELALAGTSSRVRLARPPA